MLMNLRRLLTYLEDIFVAGKKKRTQRIREKVESSVIIIALGGEPRELSYRLT